MAERPHLAILMASLYTGGVGKMRLHLMNEFARRGYRIDLVMAEARGPYLPLVHPSIRQIKIAGSHEVWGIPSLALYFRKHRPEAMLTQRVRLNVLALRAQALARTDARIWVTVNVNMSAKLTEQSPAKRQRQIAKLRSYFPRNAGIISVSRGVAEDAASLIGIPLDQVAVLPNPTLTPEVFEKAAQALDHPWFKPGEPPVILGVGRLMREKCYPVLLQAFAKARLQTPCRLMILGEGPDRPALEALIASLGIGDHVALPGFTLNPYQYMANAALFALSSSREGSPNALTEALALGTPIVSMDCPDGPYDLLEAGRHGRLVPVGDVDAMARALVDSLAHPAGDRDSRMAAAGRYTVERSATLYLQTMGLTNA